MEKKRGRPKGSRFDKCYRLRVESSNLDKLRTISDLTGLPVSRIIRELISDFIDRFEIGTF